MKIQRRFTKPGQSPFAQINFTKRTSEIRNPDGSLVFQLEGIEIPEDWTQVATDIIAQKYFRKAGVPADSWPGDGELFRFSADVFNERELGQGGGLDPLGRLPLEGT